MHKNTLIAIEYILKLSPVAESTETYSQVKQTDGFWKMVIRIDEEKENYVASIKSVADVIGRFFGEQLDIEVKGNILFIS